MRGHRETKALALYWGKLCGGWMILATLVLALSLFFWPTAALAAIAFPNILLAAHARCFGSTYSKPRIHQVFQIVPLEEKKLKKTGLISAAAFSVIALLVVTIGLARASWLASAEKSSGLPACFVLSFGLIHLLIVCFLARCDRLPSSERSDLTLVLIALMSELLGLMLTRPDEVFKAIAVIAVIGVSGLLILFFPRIPQETRHEQTPHASTVFLDLAAAKKEELSQWRRIALFIALYFAFECVSSLIGSRVEFGFVEIMACAELIMNHFRLVDSMGAGSWLNLLPVSSIQICRSFYLQAMKNTLPGIVGLLGLKILAEIFPILGALDLFGTLGALELTMFLFAVSLIGFAGALFLSLYQDLIFKRTLKTGLLVGGVFWLVLCLAQLPILPMGIAVLIVSAIALKTIEYSAKRKWN